MIPMDRGVVKDLRSFGGSGGSLGKPQSYRVPCCLQPLKQRYSHEKVRLQTMTIAAGILCNGGIARSDADR